MIARCPTAGALDDWLSDRLAKLASDDVATHVSGCPQCQSALDRLTDAPDLRLWARTDAADGTAVTRLFRFGTTVAAGEAACPRCGGGVPVSVDAVETPTACPACTTRLRLARPAVPAVRRLGRYDLIEPVGRGAFGVVWRARDTELDRVVAVKVPRPGVFDEPADRDGFFREARNAAQLRHPGIVAVYDVGRTADTVYVVSEFVAGPTLADELNAGRPAPESAVDLVAAVADALQHAHDQGVIHRDLKPANILIQKTDDRGQRTESPSDVPSSVLCPLSSGNPKVADFGLAKRQSAEATLAIEGQVLGTPAYMAPEQARGEASRADARTDVYALGVILYELLTGERPFRGTVAAVLAQVAEDDPVPPRRLDRRVPRDLETVCLTCMAKEPARRYATAAAVAADLRRWRAGEPVLARPLGPAGRAWRWCRRNPRVAGLTVVVAVLLVALAGGGAGATAWIATTNRQLRIEKTAAETERDRADANAAAAAAHYRLALDSLGTLVTTVQRQLGGRPGTLTLRKDLLDTARAGLDRIIRNAQDTPDAAGLRQTAYDRLGDLLLVMGHTAEARSAFDKALALAGERVSARPQDAAARRDQAVAHDKLGQMDLLAGNVPATEDHYRAARLIREELAARSPPPPQAGRDLAVSYGKLGDTRLAAGDAAAARGWFERALARTEALPDDIPDRPKASDLRFVHGRLGDVALASLDFPTAAAHYRRSLEYAEGLAAAAPSDSARQAELTVSLDRYGKVALRVGDLAAAGTSFRRSLALRQATAAADAGNADARRNVATAFSLLGDWDRGRRDWAAARADYGRAVAICEELARADPTSAQALGDVGINLDKLADAATRAGDFVQARADADRLVQLYRRAEAAGHPTSPLIKTAREQAENSRAILAACVSYLATEPSAAEPAEFHYGLLLYRGLHFAWTGRHAEAAAIAAELRRQTAVPAARSHAAWVMAACAGAVARAGPPTPEVENLRRKYRDACLDDLRAFAEQWPALFPRTGYEPDVQVLYADPVFQKGLRTIGRALESANNRGTAPTHTN